MLKKRSLVVAATPTGKRRSHVDSERRSNVLNKVVELLEPALVAAIPPSLYLEMDRILGTYCSENDFANVRRLQEGLDRMYDLLRTHMRRDADCFQVLLSILTVGATQIPDFALVAAVITDCRLDGFRLVSDRGGAALPTFMTFILECLQNLCAITELPAAVGELTLKMLDEVAAALLVSLTRSQSLCVYEASSKHRGSVAEDDARASELIARMAYAFVLFVKEFAAPQLSLLAAEARHGSLGWTEVDATLFDVVALLSVAISSTPVLISNSAECEPLVRTVVASFVEQTARALSRGEGGADAVASLRTFLLLDELTTKLPYEEYWWSLVPEQAGTRHATPRALALELIGRLAGPDERLARAAVDLLIARNPALAHTKAAVNALHYALTTDAPLS